MSSPKRCIFLTGAPDAEALRWDERSLFNSFQPRLQRFLGTLDLDSIGDVNPTSTAPLAKWRSLPYKLSDEEPSVPLQDACRGTLCLKKKVVTENHNHEDFEFFEYSIAVLDELDSSQIIPTAPEGNDDSEFQTTVLSFDSTSNTDTSILTSNDSLNSPSSTATEAERGNLTISGPITDLKRLPNADHITQIQPQTITVNLLCGIITVSPIRTVSLRRRNAEMDIVEVVVGDETRAGFTITFWLSPTKGRAKQALDQREELRRLQSGQVVWLQNVALSCFKGTVYGQSLSRRFAKNSTSVTVLGDGQKMALSTPLVYKLQKVQDWTADFVGVAKKRVSTVDAKNGGRKRKVDDLPPDTQE